MKFDFKEFVDKGSLLTKDYIIRYEQNNKIIFRKGVESLDVMQYFTFDCSTGARKILSKEELSLIPISTIEELDKEAGQKGFKKNPNRAFGKIAVIEINVQGTIFMYQNVVWRKITSME